MTQPGTEAQPLRVAIIGAGPSGFYAAEHLLSHPEIVVEVDLIDRLPTPYGLVRYGVAPDHQKIKSVTAAYDKTAANPRFRFFGNVEFGKHLTREDLAAHYHQILFTTGAQTDRRIGIAGEALAGHSPAPGCAGRVPEPGDPGTRRSPRGRRHGGRGGGRAR